MSFVVSAPRAMAAAAGELAGIGATLEGAATAAAGSTTNVAAAAADDVSTAISEFFGGYGQEFQAISARAGTLYAEFLSQLNGGAAAYAVTETANADTVLQSGAASAEAGVGNGAYQRLFANTTANLQLIGNGWAAQPFPFLNQVLVNERRYGQQLAINFGNVFQTAPPIESAPTTAQVSTQQLLAFDAASRVQELITKQIGFGQAAGTELNGAATDLVAGLPGYSSTLQMAYNDALAGNFKTAVGDLVKAQLGLLITGYDVDHVTYAISADSFDVAVRPTLIGPLGHTFAAARIPGENLQYLSDLMPPGSFPQSVTHNAADTINALALPRITGIVSASLTPIGVQFTADFGLPLVLAYALTGPPVTMLDALAGSAETLNHAFAAGNGVAAVNALIDAPAVAVDGFLNGEHVVDETIPLTLEAPLNATVPIVLHVPFSGLLVAPRHVTATIDLRPLNINPIDLTIGGTPFAGLVPLLVHYMPQRLAAGITPAP